MQIFKILLYTNTIKILQQSVIMIQNASNYRYSQEHFGRKERRSSTKFRSSSHRVEVINEVPHA